MGTQGLSGRMAWCRRNADRGGIARMSVITAALAVTPLLAGCSSFSSSSSAPSANQTVAMPPPPNAGAPASASAAPAYPPPQAQQQANAGTSNGFVNMFRDPPPGYDARASTYPQQSVSDLFKGSTDQRAAPDPSGAGYPLQPLMNSQQANVPHPPSTYTPSQQPYVPPQPPAAYTPPGQPAYAAPQPTPTAYTPPPPAPPPAAQPAAANTGASNGYPYPQRTLFEWPGSTQTQNVPRPPSSYTPSGQPYTPPGGAPGAAAPATQPPPEPESAGGAYPQQSLSDLFKNGGQ